MEHFFNIAGPSEARKHYLIDPLQRINVRQIETLIAQEYYFVLHAPRQTGKTSCLLALMEYLNQQNHYQALYVNIETAQVARNDVARGNYTVAESIAMAADYGSGKIVTAADFIISARNSKFIAYNFVVAVSI